MDSQIFINMSSANIFGGNFFRVCTVFFLIVEMMILFYFPHEDGITGSSCLHIGVKRLWIEFIFVFNFVPTRTVSQNEFTQKLPQEAPQSRDEALQRLALMQDRLQEAKQRMEAKTAFFMQQYQSRPEDKYQGRFTSTLHGTGLVLCAY